MSNETTTTVSVRVEPGLLEKIDALAAELSAKASGIHVSRSDAIRVALERTLTIKKQK